MNTSTLLTLSRHASTLSVLLKPEGSQREASPPLASAKQMGSMCVHVRQRPGGSRVEDGDGVGGEAVEVIVGLVYGRMRGHVYEVLPDIEVGVGNCGSGSGVDDLASVKELLFVFGSYWNERAKTKM